MSAAGIEATGIEKQPAQRFDAPGSAAESGDDEARHDPTETKLGIWILTIGGCLGISALFGLSVVVLPRGSEGLMCCCGPLLIPVLAAFFGGMAWREFVPTAANQVATGVAVVLAVVLFAVALLIVFLFACTAVAPAANLR